MKLYTPRIATTMQCHKQFADSCSQPTPRETSIRDAGATHYTPEHHPSYLDPNGGSWFVGHSVEDTPLVMMRPYGDPALSGISSSGMDASLYSCSDFILEPKEHHHSVFQPIPHPYLMHERGSLFSGHESHIFFNQAARMELYTAMDSPSPPEQSDSDSDHGGSPGPEYLEVDEASQNRPYAQLIHEALMSKADKQMVLNEIYEYFRQRWPKFKQSTGKGWMNSIRHNLSMNGAFEKIDRPEGDQGKGYIWKLTESAIRNGVKSTTRYRKQGANAKKRVGDSSPAECSPKRFKRESSGPASSLPGPLDNIRARRPSDMSTVSSLSSQSHHGSNTETLSCVLSVPPSLGSETAGMQSDEAFYGPVKQEPAYQFAGHHFVSQPEPDAYYYSYAPMHYLPGHMAYNLHPSLATLGSRSEDYDPMDAQNEPGSSTFCDQADMLDQPL